MKFVRHTAFSLIMALVPAGVFAQMPQTGTTQSQPAKSSKPTASASTPSQQEISDAKSKGMVWVNTRTKVYHTADDRYYGTTKSGKFMTEADAQKAGYRAAKQSATSKKKAAAASK
jgi:hypothetical protein